MKHLGFTALGRVAVNHLNIEVLCLMYFSDGSHRAFKQGHSNARNKLIFHGPLLKFLRAAERCCIYTGPNTPQQGEENEKDLLYSSLSKVKYIKQIPFRFK